MKKQRELTVDDVFKPKAAVAASDVAKERDHSPKPTGRILDTLPPEPVFEPQAALLQPDAPEPAVEARVAPKAKAATKVAPQAKRASTIVSGPNEAAPVKARRGRPPKDRSAVPVVSSPAQTLAAPVRPTVTAAHPAPAAFVYPDPGQIIAPSSERGVKKAALHAGRLTHGIRAEIASFLPRGERWKRRLPKVLW